MAPCPSNADGMNMPTPNFRSLHRVLTVGDSLSGWWRGLDGPKGSLFRLEWGRDCLRALQLHGHTQSNEFSVSPLFKLGPGHALTVAHSLDDMHLVVRCYAPPKAAPAAAEAAAAAATLAAAPSPSFPSPSARTPRRRGGGLEGATAAVDAAASPPAVGSAGKGTSFAAEVLRFMSGQVQAPRKATRRSQKRANSLSANSTQATVPAALWGVAGSGGDASEGEEAQVSVGPVSGAGTGSPGFPAGHMPSSSAPHASFMNDPLPHQVAAAAGASNSSSSSASYMPSSSRSNGSSWAPHTHTHARGMSPVGTASGSTTPVGTTVSRGLGSSGRASTSAGANRSSALTQELHAIHVGPSPSVHASPPALSGPAISTHHFVRLRPALPSKQHPLLGLWKGIHGQHGLQVLEVFTDFLGPSAKILGQKATGDVNVPAGKVCWWAFASPMAPEEATSEQEVRLQQARQ
ncbi:hypothetical protein DUNSADRAFT_7050 [Dunaliella salina]|uniref:Uncharacterized protein n=1 Tax=Dunaliella salina TaxID=3046 RepID=A0ABQ7H6J9_DUNSA|nr:hypothetical protein DUNSADRAFT_7050 [Dunaliella salina]|eukprot:KAF5842441.1 hypothetical protein DUNSADRAFT_7050 [Dunaliella salina]